MARHSRIRGNECAREGAISARWKSVSGEAKTPKPKVTASLRGGVESNWKRTGGPQDNELDSAGCGDEPAHSWRSPKLARHAGIGVESDAGAHHVVGGGTSGRCRETSGETCRRGDGGRSQSLRSTARLKRSPWRNGWETGVMLGGKPWSLHTAEAVGKVRKAKPRRGKGGRKVDVERLERGRV